MILNFWCFVVVVVNFSFIMGLWISAKTGGVEGNYFFSSILMSSKYVSQKTKCIVWAFNKHTNTDGPFINCIYFLILSDSISVVKELAVELDLCLNPGSGV